MAAIVQGETDAQCVGRAVRGGEAKARGGCGDISRTG
jgi:hypothetical protein